MINFKFSRGFSYLQLLIIAGLIIVSTVIFFKVIKPKNFEAVIKNPTASCIGDTISFIVENKTCKKYVEQIKSVQAVCQSGATMNNLSQIMKSAAEAKCRTDIKK